MVDRAHWMESCRERKLLAIGVTLELWMNELTYSIAWSEWKAWLVLHALWSSGGLGVKARRPYGGLLLKLLLTVSYSHTLVKPQCTKHVILA